MKRFIFFFLFLPAFLSAQPQTKPPENVTIDSTTHTYYFQDSIWFEVTTFHYSNKGKESRDWPMCKNAAECDTASITEAVLNLSANAWGEWSGYKGTARAAFANARDVQRDGVVFFNTILGGSSEFVKAQNNKHFATMAGRYTISTPDMPGTDFNLTQQPNGTCRLVMTADTNVFLTAILTSLSTIRFREKAHAKGSMIVTGVSQLAGDQVSVNGTTLTEGVHFTAVTNVTTTAANLAAAITGLVANVTATSQGATVTITARKPGTSGNSIGMTYTQGTGNGLTLSGNSLAGGSNSVETTFDVGFEYLNNNQKPVFFDNSRQVKLVKKQ
jgi:hypothetical protein